MKILDGLGCIASAAAVSVGCMVESKGERGQRDLLPLFIRVPSPKMLRIRMRKGWSHRRTERSCGRECRLVVMSVKLTCGRIFCIRQRLTFSISQARRSRIHDTTVYWADNLFPVLLWSRIYIRSVTAIIQLTRCSRRIKLDMEWRMLLAGSSVVSSLRRSFPRATTTLRGSLSSTHLLVRCPPPS